MKRTADALIIGGGVIGASVAWHLASRGLRDIVVLDDGPGSTPRATGGFRSQFATDINVRLSLLSREKLVRFREEVGADPGYRPCGYLFVAENEADRPAVRSDARAVTPAEIRRLNPAIEGDFVGGVFGPTDGFIAPLQILEGYVAAARKLGVDFESGTACRNFSLTRGRIVRASTTKGEISARHVVNAAGAWAGQVAAMAGVEIPVTPLRRQVAVTVGTNVLPADMPMTIWASDGFHFRVRDGRVLLLLPSAPAADPFDTSVDPAWIDAVAAIARSRVPCLANVPIDRANCWAGLYEMSPDRHAIVGPAPGVGNLVLVNGSSGHGVMHAPALGQLVAEIILDGAPSMDLTSLRPERFAEGRPNPTHDLL